MNKKPALIAAFLTTAVIAVLMLMIGISAYINPDSVPVASSPTAATASGAVASSNDQVAQLQALVAQYQAREQQYQSQLTQANSQIQQDAQVFAQLQQQRIISVDRNGQISIVRRRGD